MADSGGISDVAEEKVTISGPDVNLEGRLAMGDKVNGVVITHPHPRTGALWIIMSSGPQSVPFRPATGPL